MEIKNNIDNLADQIDLTINHKEGSKTIPIGLTIHYSTNDKVWWAGYGKKLLKYKTIGRTAEIALQELVKKLNT